MPVTPPTTPVTIDLTAISTPREQAVIVAPGPVEAATIAAAEHARVLALPVIAADDTCLGTITLAELTTLHRAGTPLAPTHLSAPCTRMPYLVPVAALVQALATAGMVVHSADPDDDDRPPHWFGIVTAADLNKPIFRAHLYQMLVILETSLGQLIMDEFGDDWGAIRLLSEHTQGRIREFYDEEKAEGIELSPITNATLSDLFHIAAESNRVWSLMEFVTPEELRPVARRVSDLRNVIMHPVRPLILNQRELQDLVIAIADVEALTMAISKRIGVATG